MNPHSDPTLLPTGSEPLGVLASLLATLLVAVVVGATVAFPGWSAYWPHRIARAVVLLFTASYLTIAGIGIYILVDAQLGSGVIGRDDLAFCRDATGFGAAAILALFIVKVATPQAPSTSRTVQPGSAIWVVVLVGFLGLYAVESSIELRNDLPRATIVLVLFLAVSIACDVGYDRFDIRTSARRGKQNRKDFLSAIQGPDGDFGFPLRPCALAPQGGNGHALAAWSHAQQPYVWIETSTTQRLVDQINSNVLAEQGLGCLRYLVDLRAPTGLHMHRFRMIDVVTDKTFSVEAAGDLIAIELWRLAALGFKRSFPETDT